MLSYYLLYIYICTSYNGRVWDERPASFCFPTSLYQLLEKMVLAFIVGPRTPAACKDAPGGYDGFLSAFCRSVNVFACDILHLLGIFLLVRRQFLRFHLPNSGFLSKEVAKCCWYLCRVIKVRRIPCRKSDNG